MTEIREVRCDTCGRDLTYSSNCVDYRIVLKSEEMHSRGGAVTAMMIYPQVESPLHFCGLRCLRAHPIVTPMAPPSEGSKDEEKARK